MGGVSLVTKGMICPPSVHVVESGSGGAGFVKKEEDKKPVILVTGVNIKDAGKSKSESVKISTTTVKIT